MAGPVADGDGRHVPAVILDMLIICVQLTLIIMLIIGMLKTLQLEGFDED